MSKKLVSAVKAAMPHTAAPKALTLLQAAARFLTGAEKNNGYDNPVPPNAPYIKAVTIGEKYKPTEALELVSDRGDGSSVNVHLVGISNRRFYLAVTYYGVGAINQKLAQTWLDKYMRALTKLNLLDVKKSLSIRYTSYDLEGSFDKYTVWLAALSPAQVKRMKESIVAGLPSVRKDYSAEYAPHLKALWSAVMSIEGVSNSVPDDGSPEANSLKSIANNLKYTVRQDLEELEAAIKRYHTPK